MFTILTEIKSFEPHKEKCITHVVSLLSLHVNKSVLRKFAILLSASDDTSNKIQVLNVKFAFWINKLESKSRHMYCIEVSYFSPLILCFTYKQKAAKGHRFNAVSSTCCMDLWHYHLLGAIITLINSLLRAHGACTSFHTSTNPKDTTQLLIK